MKRVVSQTAALHIAFWQYDPWYRRAWFIWPQAIAILVAGWLLADHGALPVSKWATPADCSNASSPGCAATRRVMISWANEVASPTIANQTTVSVDRSAFRNSAASDQPKLSAALGAYYRSEGAKAIDILKSATRADPNVQYLSALALLTAAGTTDQMRDAQTLLRNSVAAGHRQAAAVLGRILFVGFGGLPKDEAAGRKLIEDAADAGDTYGMRVAAAGYVSGEFSGTYDSVKALDRLRRAADEGEPIAMAQLAYSISTGRGGLTRDDAKVLDYLRRSADAGYLEAQNTLGRWFALRYVNHETEDPSEGIKWYERAYQRSYSFTALVDLAYTYRYARMPWFDTKRSFQLLQLCASYKYLHCQYWLARAYREGAGTERDLVKAYAHYTVAQQLGRKEAASELQQLDGSLQPAAKTTATELATSISASLRPMPPAIVLQSQEADSAGPSPWAASPVSQTAFELKRTAVVDQPLQVEFLYSINPDCSSIGVAAVRTVEEPKHGKLTVSKGSGFTNFPKDNPREACNHRRSEGMLVYYRPDAGYLGPDSLTVEIIYGGGTSQKRQYVIAVNPRPAPIEQSSAAASGQQVRIGFLSDVNPDCSSNAFAGVRVVEEPKHGAVTLKGDSAFPNFAKNHPRVECNNQKSDLTAVLYRGDQGYNGNDSVTVEVAYTDGRRVSVHYSIDVK